MSRRDNNQQRSINFTPSIIIHEKTKAGIVDAVRELRRRFGRSTAIHQQTHPIAMTCDSKSKKLKEYAQYITALTCSLEELEFFTDIQFTLILIYANKNAGQQAHEIEPIRCPTGP